ncbi:MULTISPECIES: hypothetical protein [unclassified Variovorax]|uniref:hypothetical protein n=1 Tax=unclassified Variovorax TaxID=663243 RepID=UPI00076C837A|nr:MULTISPECIES: hypothetical protein [unclassified Variovorax]PNG49859.1 hypothetical protein CHC06_05440 [Variovorax sp. B2]VTU42290.1 hypothetical protein H6P1_00149 [Variovorax sp. PBL-H6]KWT98468.1 hypothetical protein APY03_0603 [Variovorax sp. WDL1]PNG50731.1 hypothetical protein CHC07_05345 [Variovorax sp. B4]VTU44090.1 hypothetical protein SRS16P1_00753 [Variovorax sp. SRS16]
MPVLVPAAYCLVVMLLAAWFAMDALTLPIGRGLKRYAIVVCALSAAPLLHLLESRAQAPGWTTAIFLGWALALASVAVLRDRRLAQTRAAKPA